VKTSKTSQHTMLFLVLFIIREREREHQFHSGRHILMQVTSTPQNDKPLSLSFTCCRFPQIPSKQKAEVAWIKNKTRCNFV
jgi:hypothetical protein